MNDRVLIVDDNRDAADALARLVESFGYDTKAVYNGEDAIRETAKFLPDMALIDLEMPGLNGYQTVARMRQRRPAAEIIVVAVTGFTGAEHKQRAYDAGFDLFVVKPMGAKELRDLLGLLDPPAPEISSRDASLDEYENCIAGVGSAA